MNNSAFYITYQLNDLHRFTTVLFSSLTNFTVHLKIRFLILNFHCEVSNSEIDSQKLMQLLLLSQLTLLRLYNSLPALYISSAHSSHFTAFTSRCNLQSLHWLGTFITIKIKMIQRLLTPDGSTSGLYQVQRTSFDFLLISVTSRRANISMRPVNRYLRPLPLRDQRASESTGLIVFPHFRSAGQRRRHRVRRRHIVRSGSVFFDSLGGRQVWCRRRYGQRRRLVGSRLNVCVGGRSRQW